jgi:hypothetical protein
LYRQEEAKIERNNREEGRNTEEQLNRESETNGGNRRRQKGEIYVN